MSPDEVAEPGQVDPSRSPSEAGTGAVVSQAAQPNERRLAGGSVGGPVKKAWREGTLTRAQELESLSAWIRGRVSPDSEVLLEAVCLHVDAARQAACAPRRRFADQPLLEIINGGSSVPC